MKMVLPIRGGDYFINIDDESGEVILKGVFRIKEFISDFGDLVCNEKDQDASGYVDESLGRMKQQEVLDIVLPIAERAKFVSETDRVVFGMEEIGLFKYEKTNQLVWIVNFGWLEINGEKTENYLDNRIASIKVADATGKIYSVRQKGMESEMNYSDFLKLLEEDKSLG